MASVRATRPPRVEAKPKRLIFAVVSVNGSTKALATHGDRESAVALNAFYALGQHMLPGTGGRIVKVMGEGMLFAFPTNKARAAVDMLERLQEEGTNLWKAHDARCSVQVRAGAGTLLVGRFGPPGDKREDIYGHALNMVFKAPLKDMLILPELRALLR